jgi:outer membrane lipoprotein-sorting protein
MKLNIAAGFFGVTLSFFATIARAQVSAPVPPAQDVVEKMMQFDAQRQSQLTGYTATRRYVAVNKTRHAEMTVHVECARDGAKQFTIVSEEGSGSIRKHVFQKLLSEETEASRRGTRTSTRLIPANYDFQIVGQETLATGPTYVLEVLPKKANKYLINGKIWVDANDYSIVRIEGQPARNPSFWVHSVHFVHTYQKVGQFWFASSTDTTSEIRIFGESELKIENVDYKLGVPGKSNTAPIELEKEARLVR